MLDNIEDPDKNGQFRETENIGYARRRTKQKHNKET
jgi:hypothetical protein